MSRKDAVAFFYKHSGYMGPVGASKKEKAAARRKHAEEMATAEEVAADLEWEFVWEEDPEGMSTLGEGEEIGENVSEVLWCALKDKDGNVLESLGGISFGYNQADNRRYGRLVEAELASEALARINEGQTADPY